MRQRRSFEIRGIVQGVGFRPALHRLATQAGLGGSVRNTAGCVELTLEGDAAAIEAFLAALPARLPPQAVIDTLVLVATLPLAPDAPSEPFEIIASASADEPLVVIPPDLRVCPDCLREITDAANRRHGYAFTTCTQCGPRYTVTRQTPFDRERTSLDRFPMCAACRAEYADPADRRFHAETIACPACVAVRGIGGFLLTADARQRAPLARLRELKRRPHKPLAVMARDLAVVRQVCELPPAAAALLASPAAPIVILDTRPDAAAWPLDLLTPDAPTLGVMLPTSPLHHLLATRLAGDPTPDFDLLVMTSGNRRNEPICLTDTEAADRLRGIADFVLTHDRDVLLRCDDSVAVIRRGQPQLWRRSRGYAAAPLRLKQPLRQRVLAAGADMKNCVAFGHDASLVVMPHTGDLDTPEARVAYDALLAGVPGFLHKTPQAVAVDLHPDMYATRAGRAWAAAHSLPVVAVQHHHAHAAACLAENGVSDGLALVFDGTGYGEDDAIWGAELLHIQPTGCRRLATFAPAPLPGGDAAVREPARQAVARLAAAGLDTGAIQRLLPALSTEQVAVWTAQSRDTRLAPSTHACGRLFDSVAVLLGVAPAVITYEGQPAIRLEALARRAVGPTGDDGLPFATHTADGLLQVDWAPAVRRLAEAVSLSGFEAAPLACAFHRAIVRAAVAMVEYGAGVTGVHRVGLSGGVFMNRLLDAWTVDALAGRGFDVLTHRELPPTDGCIAAGQAVVAGGQDE